MDETRKTQLAWLLHVHGGGGTSYESGYSSNPLIYTRLNNCRKLFEKLTQQYEEAQRKIQLEIEEVTGNLRVALKEQAPTDEEIYRLVELMVLEKEGLEQLPFDRPTPLKEN